MKRNYLIIFDLDGTLAESKAPLDQEMASLLCELLTREKVAVISGASFAQFEMQFLAHLTCGQLALANLLILPASGGSFYKYDKGWKLIYQKALTSAEEKKIDDAIEVVLEDLHMTPADLPQQKIYGQQIEDRGSEVTFSDLGQKAPLSVKESWDPDHKKREAMVAKLTPLLPEFEINIGGMTSIDITKKGVDKEHGILAIAKYLHLKKSEILYVGDALFVGGNDYGAVKAGVETHAVKNPTETKDFIRSILKK
jgi:HAD superfamily hydrolase (TIGR01484 family)